MDPNKIDKQDCQVCEAEYDLDDLTKLGNEYFCDEECARDRLDELNGFQEQGTLLDSEFATMMAIINDLTNINVPRY